VTIGALGAPPTTSQLAEWVREARQRVIDLVSDLDDDQMVGPVLPTVNPLIWEIGHLGWFTEIFALRRALGEPATIEHADALWDSAAIPHDTRWYLRLPSREQTVAYIRDVAERVAQRVLRDDATDALHHIARYAVHHDDMHTEAITYTRQTLGYPPPSLPGLSDTGPGPDVDAGAHPGDAAVPGGVFMLGALRSEPFVFDNEKWVHPVRVEPFRIARAATTQSAYAAFVEEGGYRRAELWSTEGWEWCKRVAAEHPVYWRRDGSGGWQRRHFDRWAALEPHRPVSHVNWYEADAYSRWAGRRLPTEVEWEVAAIGVPEGGGGLSSTRRAFPWGDAAPAPHHANLDWRSMGHADVAAFPAGDSAFGCRQMIGNVWEWTSSVFGPYPGFERDAYQQNSEPWFGTRRVLRGGAWATRGTLDARHPAQLLHPGPARRVRWFSHRRNDVTTPDVSTSGVPQTGDRPSTEMRPRNP